MPDRWIIRVAGKEYGPVDLDVLKEWKREGRLLLGNEARLEGESEWSTAGAIPGLFEFEQPPVRTEVIAHRSSLPVQQPTIPDQKSGPESPTRNILRETFRIYFRGFLQFFALTLLTLVPSLCSQFSGAMIRSAPNVNVDLRTLFTATISVCMFVLTLVLWPIYV